MKMTQPMIPYGYVAYTGKTLSSRAVDIYNRLTREINGWIEAEREVPEHLLNERHRHFVIASELT